MVTGESCDNFSKGWSKKRSPIKCSKGLERIIKTCLSKNPFFRYSSVKILKNKLLELNVKNRMIYSKDSHSDEPIRIAIAGSQSRIGTTHLALLITSYLNHINNKGLYIEKNDSGHINTIIGRLKSTKTKDGVYQIQGCNLIPSYKIKMPVNTKKYPYHIMDYGVLDIHNIYDFLEADMKALIIGNKEWELDQSEKVLKLIDTQENVKIFLNFIDGGQFLEIAKRMWELPCYRVPYEPNPFTKNYNDSVVEFMETIMNC